MVFPMAVGESFGPSQKTAGLWSNSCLRTKKLRCSSLCRWTQDVPGDTIQFPSSYCWKWRACHQKTGSTAVSLGDFHSQVPRIDSGCHRTQSFQVKLLQNLWKDQVQGLRGRTSLCGAVSGSKSLLYQAFWLRFHIDSGEHTGVIVSFLLTPLENSSDSIDLW